MTAERQACPDGGTCHHECAASACFRVRAAGPLSGVFPRNEWPAEIQREHGVEPEPAQPTIEQMYDAALYGALAIAREHGEELDQPAFRAMWDAAHGVRHPEHEKAIDTLSEIIAAHRVYPSRRFTLSPDELDALVALATPGVAL